MSSKVGIDIPTGAIPERLCCIFPKRDADDCDEVKPALPASLPHRQADGRTIAHLLGAGYTLNKVASLVPDAPPRQVQNRKPAKQNANAATPSKPRSEFDTLKNRFSKRGQDWCSANGVFAGNARSTNVTQKAQKIFERLKELTDAQLFYGTIGHIHQDGSFTYTPPGDKCFNTSVDWSVRYNLRRPKDVPQEVRKGLLSVFGVTRISFEGWLRLNPQDYNHWFGGPNPTQSAVVPTPLVQAPDQVQDFQPLLLDMKPQQNWAGAGTVAGKYRPQNFASPYFQEPDYALPPPDIAWLGTNQAEQVGAQDDALPNRLAQPGFGSMDVANSTYYGPLGFEAVGNDQQGQEQLLDLPAQNDFPPEQYDGGLSNMNSFDPEPMTDIQQQEQDQSQILAPAPVHPPARLLILDFSDFIVDPELDYGVDNGPSN